jgi:beta-N-acetylhexosaminidase
MKPAAARRRRAALGVTAAAALVAGAVVGAGASNGDEEKTAATAAAPTCPQEIASKPARLAGEMLIVGMEASATDGIRHALRAGEIAGVILFPPAGVSESAIATEISKLERVAARTGQPPPVIAVDQEGGEVKRFAALPPELSAPQMGAEGARTAHSQGRKTGRALAKLGINVDLAPVADIPAVDGAFIESRSFGKQPGRVARLVSAFGEGLEETGVAATAKHFPGLGHATINTDFEPSTIDASRHAIARGFPPFRPAAGFPLVMVANAIYPAYDAKLPASLSRRIVSGVLRDQLGYEGVVITDALGAGAITGAGYDSGEAAVAAARAGNDLLLFASSESSQVHKELTRAIRRHDSLRERAVSACARVNSLREGFPG